ncbi:MAG: hypothetical protein NT070_06985 [Cyanobacteria bacterium]|nr:hypothetical protein [Cyanobacteriota bacterium]
MALLRNKNQITIADQLAKIKLMQVISPEVYRQITTTLLSSKSLPPEIRQMMIILLDGIKLGVIKIIPDQPKFKNDFKL